MATILIKVIKKLLSLLVKATQWLFVKHTLKKQGTPTRTHPAKDHRQERYVHQGVPQRELPGFLFCLRDEPVPPAMRQTLAVLPRCSSRQGWPGRMPVPDGRWLHRDKGKCLWTFSFCSNARSFDRPTVAEPGEKIKVPIFIRRKGADVFCPALAAGGSLMAYKCLSLCDFFIVQHFFKLCHIRFVLLEDF